MQIYINTDHAKPAVDANAMARVFGVAAQTLTR